MPRLVNGERKITTPKPENAGKLLIFCEGNTEYNYIKYLKDYLECHRHFQYSDIIIEQINTKGNAMHVYNYAEEFLNDDERARKYIYHEKHLIFDCDAPGNIQEVIRIMQASRHRYKLDYSNLLFETWMVMHFQTLKPEEKNGKREIIRLIRDYLGVPQYITRIKAAKGTIGKILGSNGNEKIRAAIENAKELERHWKREEKELSKDIIQMNPSVDVYKLIECLFDEIVYSCS